jgi:hypothetical protein
MKLGQYILTSLTTAIVLLRVASAQSVQQTGVQRSSLLKQLSELNAEELIPRLLEPTSRSEAFYELWRRTHPEKNIGYSAFRNSHYAPEVAVCPQPNGQPPLYLVLYGYWDLAPLDTVAYPFDDILDLFEPVFQARGIKLWTSPAACVFTQNGAPADPFGQDDRLRNPVFKDITGDGQLECIEQIELGSDLNPATALRVRTIAHKAQPVFSVLYNQRNDTCAWDFQTTDENGDGTFDIELGPRSTVGIETQVTYRWDADSRSFDGPKGGVGQHFMVLAPDNTYEEIRKLR